MSDLDIKTIVLGYDGSEGADKALGLACPCAEHELRIVIVTVMTRRAPTRDEQWPSRDRR